MHILEKGYIMGKRYRTSSPPTFKKDTNIPNLSGVREYSFPSNRIQGNNDCMFCGSKTMSYQSCCRKCRHAVSLEKLEYLERKRQGQIEAMEQERLDKEQARLDRPTYEKKDKPTNTTLEIYCMLCFLRIPLGSSNQCVICPDCI